MPAALSLIAGLAAILEILFTAADHGLLGNPDLRLVFYQYGAFWAGLLHGAQPLYPFQLVAMFFTHAFLHGGFLHMAMNMAVFLGLGRFVADRYGPGAVAPVFLIGAAAGGAAFALLSSGVYPMVGASGAVFAYLGVWIVWDWRRHRAAGLSIRPVLNRVLALAGINLALYFGLDGLVAWQAHLGGFLAGVAAGLTLESRARRIRG